MPEGPNGQTRPAGVSDKFRHDALRDTMWLGKGVRTPWLVVAGIVAAAFAAVQLASRM